MAELANTTKRGAFPLEARPVYRPGHELVLPDSGEIEVAGGVVCQDAVGLANAIGADNDVLRFVLSSGWMLDVPVSEKIRTQLRKIVATLEAPE